MFGVSLPLLYIVVPVNVGARLSHRRHSGNSPSALTLHLAHPARPRANSFAVLPMVKVHLPEETILGNKAVGFLRD